MSRRSRQRRRKNRRSPALILFLIAGVFVSVGAVGGLIGAGYVLSIAKTAPRLSTLHANLGAPSQIFAADGSRLGFVPSDVLRTPIPWEQIPANLRNATVAIEDQRFYEHNGVDPVGILRAALQDAAHGSARQGASTLTMQLIRNLYLASPKHSLKEKIIEAKLALDYEKLHDKHFILTTYLNSVPYGTVGGQTTLGVQAAARVFFDKPALQLNLQQSALLAGLPQAPSQYNPFLNAGLARQRRNEVLTKMEQLHYITGAEALAAETSSLGVKRGYFYSQRKESFFFDYVRQELVRRYGKHTVSLGGLRVYTTLNLGMQSQARAAIASTLDQRGDPAAAIVTINPANGQIQAMAESQNYNQSQFNLAAQGQRQPGSTFKAIVLADALARGVDPYTTYYLSHTLQPGWLPGYPSYQVQTFEGSSLNQPLNLVQATLASDNTVYAQLAADLGERSVTAMARRMGVVSQLKSYAAEALGGLNIGVTPLEMANVYATLADGGWRNTPIAITKVVFPNGRQDYSWGRPHRVKALSSAVVAQETDILHQNVLGGTAVNSAISCPTAAKTGTTSRLADAWLDGYTPNYATAVWMGYPNRQIPMTDVHGQPQQGGYLPAEIWHAYMSSVTANQTCLPLFSSSTFINYQVFQGKFAALGQAAWKQANVPAPKKKYPAGKQKTATTGKVKKG